jgi:hypothetical protein
MGGSIMNEKKNQALIGIIIVVIGLYSLLSQWIDFSFIRMRNLPTLFVAIALLLLYYMKRKTWALVMGMIIGFFGIVGVLPNNYINVGNFIAPMIFIIPGSIFMILYLSKRIIGFLIPGSILIWFGIFVGVIVSRIIKGMMVPAVFFGSLGTAFITMYILGYPKIGKWPLIPGGILLAFGFMFFMGVSVGFIILFAPKIIPIALIIIGLLIFLKGRKVQ